MTKRVLSSLFVLGLMLSVGVSLARADDDCVHGGHEPVIIVVDNYPFCIEYCGPPCSDGLFVSTLPASTHPGTDRPFRFPAGFTFEPAKR